MVDADRNRRMSLIADAALEKIHEMAEVLDTDGQLMLDAVFLLNHRLIRGLRAKGYDMEPVRDELTKLYHIADDGVVQH